MMSFSPDIFDGDIAICGTDSILGKALSKAFQSQGHKVVDIRDIHLHFTPPELARRLSDVKAVINLYGEPYVAKWSGRYEFDIYRSRLEALRALGIALRYTDPQPDVFLTLSNAMVYDQYDVHDEYSIEYGDSFMSEVGRMETEEAIKIERQSFSGRLVIARTGYIMSNDGGAFSVLSSLSKLGWGGRVNDGYQCLPMIHVDDAVRAILHILATNDAKGIFNLTIPQMASMNELVQAFADSIERNQHRLPKFLLKFFTGRAIGLLEQNCKVIPRRLTESNFNFVYENVRNIVANLQKGINPTNGY